MKTRQLLACLLLVLIYFGAFAGSPASAKAKKPAPPPDTRKLITDVDVKTTTIVVSDMLARTKHTYVIDLMTKVQVGNLPGQFSDLKVGMTIDDLAERDNDTLDSITVDANYTPTPTAPAKKKKK